VDGIRATVWRAHEAQIRAAVARKANEVEDHITTMGLAELIDNLLNEATTQEITETIKDDIALQVRSKFNNARLEEESKAYTAMIKEAIKEGKAKAASEALQAYASTSETLKAMKERQAQADADVYYKNLLEKAKSQARLQADSEFSRLLADELSAIAPRIDREIAAEHAKHIEERRQATAAMLQALTLDAEKECVLASATRLGLDLQGTSPAQKKQKVDQRKARPAPITPRGRSSSITSITSSSSRKRAYSPSKIATNISRDEQKTPTPEDVAKEAKAKITTVSFAIKQEGTSPFPTPSTPSVIQHAVDLATDIPLTQESVPPLRGLSSSIHNEENQMAIERESFDPASIIPTRYSSTTRESVPSPRHVPHPTIRRSGSHGRWSGTLLLTGGGNQERGTALSRSHDRKMPPAALGNYSQTRGAHDEQHPKSPPTRRARISHRTHH
jgi:hypothetical protein